MSAVGHAALAPPSGQTWLGGSQPASHAAPDKATVLFPPSEGAGGAWRASPTHPGLPAHCLTCAVLLTFLSAPVEAGALRGCGGQVDYLGRSYGRARRRFILIIGVVLGP